MRFVNRFGTLKGIEQSLGLQNFEKALKFLVDFKYKI